MRKIPSLFQRNYDSGLVRDEVTPGAEWVIAGEGVATQKFDGTCCLVRGGDLFKRHTVKKGQRPPENFMAATGVDPNTGKQQGWVPVSDNDKYHREAWGGGVVDGTYELCGPKVQGNPEGLDAHRLLRHGSVSGDAPRTFDELKAWLTICGMEGVVWHHPDGRMVKIKAKDFRLER